jgi:hypothetical protein
MLREQSVISVFATKAVTAFAEIVFWMFRGKLGGGNGDFQT